MSGETILILIVSILSFEFLSERILAYLNFRSIHAPLPGPLAGIYDADKYRKSIQYQSVRARFGAWTGLLGFVLILTVLLTGMPGKLDDLLRNHISDPVLLALAFFGIIFLLAEILSVPLSLYQTFVIEERFGFNKMNISTFFTDKLKELVLGIIFGGGMFYLFLWLVGHLQQDFWIWFWIASGLFSLLMSFFYGTLIIPLFNKLRPMEDGELKLAISSFCESVDFPIKNIYIIDGSKRSTKSNAFFMGFGKMKKIVLYDTLVENYSREELVSIFAHEVGHYKRRHILAGFLFSTLQMGLMLYFLSLLIFSPDLSIALGATLPGIHLNLLAAVFLFSPISSVMGILSNFISRKFEYQADRFAKETANGEFLGEALKKMTSHHLSILNPHPAFVAVYYSHPSLLQRLSALGQESAERQA